MSLSHFRIPYVAFLPGSIASSRIEFYREEFLKVRECLEHQREYFSEQAISSIECALTRILEELEQLSDRQDADDIVEAWLRQFYCIASRDGWNDPRNVH